MHRYNLNLPRSLFEKIVAIARWNRRHTSQEIIIAIEERIQRERGLDASPSPTETKKSD